ncbi:HIT domain-containing protein [Shewanella violacea]|uniref:HIT family protein n=1 Tax=Shewanella violacea (strain JCM 10179 / CIP 106290 / LMG 19151 / DSS12) TaxID=637905 RepID=D4ZAK1_SHEVD|nr:HIT domain-containing protein [Shewanella violacea]BAJ03046.1 HIT family protein [Shewanella violacea DSS12]
MKSLIILLFGILVSNSLSANVSVEQLELLYSKPSVFESKPESEWLAQSENAFVIKSKYPQAPVHLLVIPKERVPTILQASEALIGEMFSLARKVAKENGIVQDGFRIIINTHPYGGQSVYHLHIHVLGGKELGWAPGFRLTD